MKVSELIKELQQYPADTKVLLDDYKRIDMNLSPLSDIEEVYHDNGAVIIATLNDIGLV